MQDPRVVSWSNSQDQTQDSTDAPKVLLQEYLSVENKTAVATNVEAAEDVYRRYRVSLPDSQEEERVWPRCADGALHPSCGLRIRV